MPVRRIVQQPAGSRLCGQCCVAMLVDRNLDSVIENFGTGRSGRGSTNTHSLRRVLRSYGFRPSRTYLLRRPCSCPPSSVVAIARVTWPGKHGTHWVIFDAGQLIDPASPYCDEHHLCWPQGTRITSYFVVQYLTSKDERHTNESDPSTADTAR